jgi:exopolysaccharide biosynthesis predicted pyruvyltransferase EpsI
VAKTHEALADQLRERWSQVLFAYASLRTMKWSRKAKKVILLGSPYHSNLGDQAQTLCTEEWLADNYPGHSVVVFDTRTASVAKRAIVRLASRFITSADVIFLHSGYHTTDLYPLELDLQKWAVQRFPRNQIVVLPQTINFVDPAQGEDMAAVVNGHSRVAMMCRDDQSHELAHTLFPEARLFLYPDIVTSQIGTRRNAMKRSGIQLCVRRDVESVYFATGLIDQLEQGLGTIAPTVLTDTNSEQSPIAVRRHLREVVETAWTEFSKYRVTVTDRYHGVIFSLIAGTPVVVLESADHKLRSGVRWFPPSIFGDYIAFVRSPDEAIDAARRLYDAGLPEPLPAYFRDEYYSLLADRLAVR